MSGVKKVQMMNKLFCDYFFFFCGCILLLYFVIVLTLILQIKHQINLHDGLSDGMRFKLSNGGIMLDFHNKTMVAVI